MFKPFLLMLCLVLLPSSAIAETIDWLQKLDDLRSQPIQDGASGVRQLQDLYWQWRLDVQPEIGDLIPESPVTTDAGRTTPSRPWPNESGSRRNCWTLRFK